jgi:peroxiredoxin
MGTMALDWNNRTTWHLLIALLLVLGVAWIVLSRDLDDVAAVDDVSLASPRRGFAAPDFILQTLDGQEMALSDLRGQVVLVNFWATWCPPCRAEMPAMQQVYDRYHDLGFEILAVNLQEQDAQMLGFVEDRGLSFPVLPDRDGSVSSAYRVTSLPTSFFVDRSGVIDEVVVGGPLSRALIESKVTALLAREDGM